MAESEKKLYSEDIESNANNIYEAIVLLSDYKIRKIIELINVENAELAEALEKKLF